MSVALKCEVLPCVSLTTRASGALGSKRFQPCNYSAIGRAEGRGHCVGHTCASKDSSHAIAKCQKRVPVSS